MKGCCLGCLAMGLLIVVVCVASVAVVARMAMTFYEPVELAEVYGDTHAVTFMMDPYVEGALDTLGNAVDEQEEAVAYWMPHQGIMFGDVDREQGHKTLAMAVSTKRFGRVISWFLPAPEDFGEELNVETGVEFKAVEFKEDGVLHIAAQTAISQEALDNAAEWWPESAAPAAALTGGHLFEFVLDNAGGGAYLILESQIAAVQPDDEEAVLEKEEWETLFRQVSTFRMTGDVVDNETLEFVIDVECADRDTAEEVVEILKLLQEDMAEDLNESDVGLEGEFLRTGAEIHGNFRLVGFSEALAEASEEAFQELRSGAYAY